MERSEKAKELFLSGQNCAQSVLLSFADDLKYSRELAAKIAAGFGGGMGKTQGTCGAVSGAIMVLGILNGEKAGDNDELKREAYASTKELISRFTASHGTISCRDLTGCDLNTSAGAEKFKQDQIMETTCADCVGHAVELVEELKS